jgi:hypothetical protein
MGGEATHYIHPTHFILVNPPFVTNNMKLRTQLAAPVLFSLLAVSASSSFAGRPLAVDDANVNDKGSGHVEAFYQRLPGGVNVYTISPAYGIMDGVEIAAAFSRDNTANVNTTTLQGKIRLTESKKDGCNFATSFGLSQPNVSGVGTSNFINGLITCNMDAAGSVHVNLGVVNPPAGAARTGVWGIAYEREFGAVTAHVEAFGQENAQPAFQIGLRTMVTKTIQIDGTVGSSNNESMYSLGLKFLF